MSSSTLAPVSLCGLNVGDMAKICKDRRNGKSWFAFFLTKLCRGLAS